MESVGYSTSYSSSSAWKRGWSRRGSLLGLSGSTDDGLRTAMPPTPGFIRVAR